MWLRSPPCRSCCRLPQVPEFGAAEVKARTSGTLDTLLAYLLEVRRVGVLPVMGSCSPQAARSTVLSSCVCVRKHHCVARHRAPPASC